MPFLTVSTVGTSLLTNALGDTAPDRIEDVRDHANDSREEIPDELYQLSKDTVEKTVSGLQGAGDGAVREASAELNGLLSFYESAPSSERDQHWLVATDTALGQLTAKGSKQILEDRGIDSVQIQTPRRLSAEDTDALEEGVKRFLNWCEKTVPGYQERGYEVVFNLTGGFKSLQGILNTVGMFYADRMIYIFKKGPELITIPRLPVELNTDLFEERPARFLRLEALEHVSKGTLPAAQFSDVPDALVDKADGRVYSFSEWGTLLWNRGHRDLLEADDCFDLPHLRYKERFRKEVRGADPDARRRLHETLAIASVLLEVHDGDTAPLKKHRSLQYENYTGTSTDDGEPIGHFRLRKNREQMRVSCEAQGGNLVLRRFGPHDEVNASP